MKIDIDWDLSDLHKASSQEMSVGELKKMFGPTSVITTPFKHKEMEIIQNNWNNFTEVS